MTSQVHEFLKYKVGLMFQELTIESGIEVPYNNSNLDFCVNAIEEYLGLDQFNVLDDEIARMDYEYE